MGVGFDLLWFGMLISWFGWISFCLEFYFMVWVFGLGFKLRLGLRLLLYCLIVFISSIG